MASSDLWAPLDARSAAAGPPKARRSLRWVVSAVPVCVLLAALGLAVALPGNLETEARLTLFGFGAAVILWSMSALNSAYVALGAVLFLVLSQAVEQDALFDALASDVIWLMFGAFVLGAAVQDTGLAGRLTQLVSRRARDVGQVLWLLTLVLIPLAFLIPSTSGRAAVMLPVFRSLSTAGADLKVTRALALLIPAVILVSTIASLTGAGSHLIANDLLDEVADERISFLAWLVYGLPFAAAASGATTFAIGRLFLDAPLRARPLDLPREPGRSFSRPETLTLAVLAVSVALWGTESVHGIEIATVSVLAAFVLTMPNVGAISWKSGLKAVSWNLILFVGAALVLGEALIETGAAEWLVQRAFAVAGLSQGGSILFTVLAVALVTLTSHVYMTSHAARAAALVPPLLYLGQTLGLDPVALMFIGTVGMDYCLTFPVSSKALLLFGEADRDSFRPSDLLKLSAVMLPVHAALMALFYFGYWRFVGLAL